MINNLNKLFIIFLLLFFKFSYSYAQTNSEDWILNSQKIDVNIESWGNDCGVRPKSYSSKGGQAVKITIGNDNINIGRHSTNKCWSDNPKVGLKRVSRSDNEWKIYCETASNDPKTEKGEYTIKLNNSTITVKLISNYDWRINLDHCKASIILSSSYEKISKSINIEKQEKVPIEEKNKKCLKTGEPKQIIISPRNRDLAPGSKLCFKVYGFDTNQCKVSIPDERVRYELKGTGKLVNNCYYAPETIGNQKNPSVYAFYKELRGVSNFLIRNMDITDLLMAQLESEDEGNTNLLSGDTQGISAVVGDNKEENIYFIIIIIVSCLGITFLFVFIFSMVIRKKKKFKDTELENSRKWICPRCNREYEDGIEYCSEDATKLIYKSSSSQNKIKENVVLWNDEKMICPKCRRGYPSNTLICSNDGTPLISYKKWLEENKTKKQEKICPVCGTIYTGDIDFCGKDGSKLINK